MKKLLFAAVLLLSGSFISAQQEYQVSHNMFNNAAINAGAAGIDNAICGQLIGRRQWEGFEGGPKTYVLNVNSNLGVFQMPNNIGTGLTFVQDNIGLTTSSSVKLSANYQLELPNGKLGLGIDLGMISMSLDQSGVNAAQTGDPVIAGLLGSGSLRANAFTGGIGGFYKTNNLYFGLSTSQLLESNTQFATATVQLRRHYYVSGGYSTQPIAGHTVIKPSIFIKTDGAVTTMDIAALAEYQSLIWAGASYRTGDAIIALVGYNVNPKMKVGASYDITTSEIATTSSAGTFELFVRYCHTIDTKTKKRIFVDPSLLQ